MFMYVHMYTDMDMKICLLRGILDIVARTSSFFFFFFLASVSSVKGKTVLEHNFRA